MSKVRKYQKLPLVVEAYQTEEELEIETLEGTMKANVGDYIITGVKGEQYICKPEVFKETYIEFVGKDELIKSYEKAPKMCVYASERAPRLFRRAFEVISDETKGHIYIAFHMGSVILDISNVNNILELDDDFVEIFNAENGELSLIKTDEVTGFIFEPEHTCNCEDEECECKEDEV